VYSICQFTLRGRNGIERSNKKNKVPSCLILFANLDKKKIRESGVGLDHGGNKKGEAGSPPGLDCVCVCQRHGGRRDWYRERGGDKETLVPRPAALGSMGGAS
jgi:hypothetical protein